MKNLLPICLCAVLLSGCPQQTSSPVNTPVVGAPLKSAAIITVKAPAEKAVPQTATIVLVQPFQRKFKGISKQEHKRHFDALSANRQLIRRYFQAVDKALLPLINLTSSLQMEPLDWRVGLTARPRDAFLHYSPDLRRNLKPVNPFPYSVERRRQTGPARRPYLTCHVWYDVNSNYKYLLAISPVLTIRKPAHGMQFEWYLDLDDGELTKKVRAILIAEARKF